MKFLSMPLKALHEAVRCHMAFAQASASWGSPPLFSCPFDNVSYFTLSPSDHLVLNLYLLPLSLCLPVSAYLLLLSF